MIGNGQVDFSLVRSASRGTLSKMLEAIKGEKVSKYITN